MFNRIARRYDATNRAMSVGIDVVWRKKAIARLVEGLGEAPRVLDLGAGTLDGALEIARRVPGARVAAADFAREMLRARAPQVRRRAPRSPRTPPTATTCPIATPPSTARSPPSACATSPICRAGCASCAGWCGRAGAS